MDNPLLNLSGLPPFSKIRPRHVEPAVDQLLAEGRAQVKSVLESKEPHTWESLVEKSDEEDDKLGRAWSPVSHMNSVVNSDGLREAYNACLPKLSEYATEVGQNEDLFAAYKSVAEQGSKLNDAQQKVLENALRDFHLSGVDLPPEKKARYKEISQAISQLTSQFSDNLLDATNAWNKLITDEAELV